MLMTPSMVFKIFDVNLDMIESAYDAGREALLKEIDKAEEGLNEYRAAVDTGEIPFDSEKIEMADLMAHHHHETIGDMLALHAQAFAVMIHHAWENHVCSVEGYPRYCIKAVYPKLIKAGWPIDEPRLERLRKVSNCIKHDDGGLYASHPEMFREALLPDMTQGKPKRNTQKALQLTAADIGDFLDTVRTSAFR